LVRFAVVVVLVGAVSACTKATPADAIDAAAFEAQAPAPASASVVAPGPQVTAPVKLEPAPLVGEWERATPPYQGLRVRIREAEAGSFDAVVTAPPSVSASRVAAHAEDLARRQHRREASEALRRRAAAELACQEAAFRPGQVLARALRAAGDGTLEGTIVVRDWGLTPRCTHRDAQGKVRIERVEEGALAFTVTRGRMKPAAQRWTRVLE
jgi:hypothetical protein